MAWQIFTWRASTRGAESEGAGPFNLAAKHSACSEDFVGLRAPTERKNDTKDLKHIVDTQHKLMKLMKAQKRRKSFSLSAVIDDFADDLVFTRQSELLHSLYTRWRHNSMITIVSTQKFAAMHPTLHVSATSRLVYCLKSNEELESHSEEVRCNRRERATGHLQDSYGRRMQCSVCEFISSRSYRNLLQ